MTKWEYLFKYWNLEDEAVRAGLDLAGGEGWELVGFEQSTFIFKRPVIGTER